MDQIVRFDGSCWRWKRGDGWREILAYKLGAGLVNVAKAVNSSRVRAASCLDGTPIEIVGAPGSSLIRLIQCYEPAEFVEPDLDRALAGELVFSAWVRRRDMHSWNRAYVDGVPGFFDHHAAFDAEVQNGVLDEFFRGGDNAGYAGTLRLRVLPEGLVPTTMTERIPEHRLLAVIRVRDRDSFDRELDSVSDLIRATSDERIRVVVDEAGSPDPDRIASLLIQWRNELPAAVRRLRAILLT